MEMTPISLRAAIAPRSDKNRGGIDECIKPNQDNQAVLTLHTK